MFFHNLINDIYPNEINDFLDIEKNYQKYLINFNDSSSDEN